MTIDWNQPICLDTVPPRKARVVRGPDRYGDYKVQADWLGNGESKAREWCRPDGSPINRDLPPVRNLTPAELAAQHQEPSALAARDGAPDDMAAKLLATQEQAAELAAALRLARDELAHFIDYSVDDALDAADAALAKWEQSK